MRCGRSILLSAVGLIALLLASCAGGIPSTRPEQPEVDTNAQGSEVLERGDPVHGGVLRWGLKAPAETLDPGSAVATGADPMRAIFDVLFVYDADGNVRPELARSIETPDGGRTWVMTLPGGVRFTDGTPFNSQAVVEHLRNLAAPNSHSRSAGDLRQIRSMETPDETTVLFTLRQPWMTFPKVFVWGLPGGPSMIPSPASVRRWGDQAGMHPVGVGPFMLESFIPGGNITLVRNPDYRLPGLPYLDKLVFVSATDSQARLAAVVAGDLDMGVTQLARDLRLAERDGLTTVEQNVGS